MSRLFTVRWPFFARLEAVALFPVAVAVASQTAQVRSLVGREVVPALMPLHDRLGLPDHVVFMTGVTMVAFVPFVALLLVADRFLTIRKGYALLSFVAVGIWAGAALELAGLLSSLVPAKWLSGTGQLSFDQEAALAAGGLALLLHLWPVWSGLRDQGQIADRLVHHRHDTGRFPLTSDQRTQDVYFLRTAAFREWQPPRQLEGHSGSPRESSAVNVIWVLTWLGVATGVGMACLNWTGHAVLNDSPKKPAPSPAVTGPTVVAPGARAGAAAATQVVLNAPATPAPDVRMPVPDVHTPSSGVHTVMNSPLPAVNRPSELSNSVETAGVLSGPNEAVAERGMDGSFAFDAVVNGGTHVRMLFDTGATVVGLRAEDASRLGISVDRLNYSAKIKTANGTAEVAPVMLDTMMVGNITLHNVPGFVARQGMLQENLLGQTFLARLSGFNVERNLLVLKGR